MVESSSKGKSPFYPTQPVPLELFVGRKAQIDQIMVRGAGQVAAGKPVAMFIRGEYGIGKSSIAAYCQFRAERELGLLGVYASLGGVESVDGIGERVLEGTVRSGAMNSTRTEAVRKFLSKYLNEVSLFGVTFKAEELRKDSPAVTAGLLKFLTDVRDRLGDSSTKGIFLVLDEINGIARDPRFAHFLKGLVDTNALSKQPLPVLLVLCGVEERRAELIQSHEPLNRIFDLVDIDLLSDREMEDFFARAFETVHMTVEDQAMRHFKRYSAGVPKIMHLVGDEAFWIAKGSVITADVAMEAVLSATEAFGKRYVDDQVYKALRSRDYHSILAKLYDKPSDRSFARARVLERLNKSERGKLDNFIQKMKVLGVLRSGRTTGEWVFTHPLVGLYLWMKSWEASNAVPDQARD